MTWLDSLPLFRSRRALAQATRTLQAHAHELAALRGQAQEQAQRLENEKQKRRRLERRLRAIDAPDSPRPLLVFDHIPKTAGTTFRRSYLIAALPPEQRWILAGGPGNERDRERFLALDAVARSRIRIVAGHDAEALRPQFPEARFVTVVRDPIDRTISSYLHARFHDDGAELWPDVKERGQSLAQFAQQYIPANAQSHALLGEDYAGLDDEGIRRRLHERYALVGYTEAFDEFVYLLHDSEGLPLCVYENRLVRAERQNYSPAEGDLEIVKRMHETDARLHRLVKEDFQARIAALSGTSRHRMGEFLESLQAFRAQAARG